MSVDIGICAFQKGCTHLYICMNSYWSVNIRKRFLSPQMKYIENMLHSANGHCGPVFYCDAYKCIWLSYKCIYIKVHLMLLMYLCRHSQDPCSSLILRITVPPPSHPLLRFCPWSEFRSATALTHTHDETEWDTIWVRLTHLLGIEALACTQSPPTYDDDAHNSRHNETPPPSHQQHHNQPPLQITLAHIRLMYLRLPDSIYRHSCSECYSQPPVRRSGEGRAGESTKRNREEAKIRGTVKRDVGQANALSHNDVNVNKI